MKRLYAQICFFILTNLNLHGFLSGTIYRGELKNLCVPGLNCYSCPGALGSCPIGALQAVAGSAKYSLSFYAFGWLALFGAALGRFTCGWLCPFGLAQDLLYRTPIKKRPFGASVDRPLRFLKYAVLLVLVLLLPMLWTDAFGLGAPWFCQFICPSGTLFGGIPLLSANTNLRQAIGVLFAWKTALLLLIVGASLFIYRPFCKYLCPLGAIYSLFNPISFYRLHIDDDKCTRCRHCEMACPMNVPLLEKPNHGECIRCGVCQKVCPNGALRHGL